jgi:hypothetical protein|tara:strand:+ start:1284 stop:1631 length:348 start_codon:yes stop_codon:yes gene_type:complete
VQVTTIPINKYSVSGITLTYQDGNIIDFWQQALIALEQWALLINRPFHPLAKSKLSFPVFMQGISAVTMFKSNQTQGKLAPDIACRLGEQATTIRLGDIAIMDSDGVLILSANVA